ncbi:MAG: Spy/CpxP family protein refolding chaperone [Steroidobacteraceae bacterium]
MRTVAAAVLLTMLAAALGGWAGVNYGIHKARANPGIDQIIHQEIRLTADQQQRLSALESSFAVRRKTLEDQMRAANRDLAATLLAHHRYGPRAEQAVDRFHVAMKTLQQETIMHILAMRAVLTPAQARQFDRIVAQVLGSASQ